MNNIDFRHEWKHEISQSDRISLRQRLQVVAEVDPHAQDGLYQIRSLYFDNAADKALLEKINGVNYREKYRLRYYNNDPSMIRLEKKTKFNGLGNKQTAPVTYEEVKMLLNGNYDWMKDQARPLLIELYSKMLSQGLRPKTIVDYTREPYLFPAGNVRVTIDYNIRTGLGSLDFLNPESPTVPIANFPIILEVKWDEYLPNIIRDMVQLTGRHTSSFSKYAASRMYG